MNDYLEEYRKKTGRAIPQPLTPLEQILLDELTETKSKLETFGFETVLLIGNEWDFRLIEAYIVVKYYFNVDIRKRTREHETLLVRQVYCYWSVQQGFTRKLTGEFLGIHGSNVTNSYKQICNWLEVKDKHVASIVKGFYRLGLFRSWSMV